MTDESWPKIPDRLSEDRVTEPLSDAQIFALVTGRLPGPGDVGLLNALVKLHRERQEAIRALRLVIDADDVFVEDDPDAWDRPLTDSDLIEPRGLIEYALAQLEGRG